MRFDPLGQKYEQPEISSYDFITGIADVFLALGLSAGAVAVGAMVGWWLA